MRGNKRLRSAALVLATAVLLGGCQAGNLEIELLPPISFQQVFKIDDEKCSKKEAQIYLTNYVNIYSNAFGLDLSDQDSLESYSKDLTLSQLARIKCMNGIAKQEEIELTKDERARAKKAAKKYYKSLSEEERKYFGVHESEIEEMYLEYMTAEKVYRTLIGSVNEEVSDDEARIMEGIRIFVKEEDKALEIQQKIRDGATFSSLAGTYNEKGKAEIIFGREDLPKEVADKAFELEDEEISDMIEAEDGYYFIQCIDKYKKDLTDRHKEEILKEKRENAFRDVYDEYVKEISTVLNKRAWKDVSAQPQKEIKTDSFFEVIDQAIQQ